MVEKFAFSYSVMTMSLHYRYRGDFHLKRLLEVSNYLLSDWLDTSRINFLKNCLGETLSTETQEAVGRDGTRKSRAKSGAAKVYKLVSANF